MNTVINRMQEDTPVFFKRLRLWGAILAVASATVLGSQIELPALAIKIAEYLTVAGSVMTAVSQTAVKNEQE